MRLGLLLFLALTSLAAADEPPDNSAKPTPEQLEFFEKKVRPILVERCHKCHGPDMQEGELRLDSRAALLKGGETGPVVKPGDPSKSELIAAVNYGADSFQMPPDGKLPPDEIAALTEWVKLGLPWPDSKPPGPADSAGREIDLAARAKHWSFQPVRRPDIPGVIGEMWPRNPVDRFLLARLELAQLQPAREADKRTLLRRLSYDLIGLPPTVEELHAFLADDSPTAYEQAVERLLASPRYGERWARHWLDLVRYAETGGHEFDYEIPHAWPYRDYLIRAFNQDLPYNQLVVEHVAGDLLETPRRRLANGDNESVVATAFYWFGQGKHSPVDIRAEECDTVDNQIDVLGKTFLGLTIACARCHDHKFDPIRARDYYALAGYLQSSRRQLAILDDPAATQSVIDRIAGLKESSRPAVEQHEAGTLLAQLDRLVALMRGAADTDPEKPAAWQKYLQETAARNPADPFHAWAALHDKQAPEQFSAARAELVKRLREIRQAASPDETIFADFNGESFGDWFVGGPAFGQQPTAGGELVWREQLSHEGSAVVEVAQAGLAHSGLVAGRLEGTLRSPTFTIQQPYIYYRARRTGGKPNPGLAVKNGQLHLIVDGFQFIKSPLYGDLSINVPNDGQWRWHRHDASKFLGSRAYLEIEDADDGAIAVDQVLFSNAAAPPDAPNSIVIDMLDDPALTTAEQLADRYRQLLADNLRLWNDGRVPTSETPAERIALVNWLIANQPLFAAPADEADPADVVTGVLKQYGALAAEIRQPRRSLAMTDGDGENEHVLIRGNHKKPGEEVPRRFLEVLAGADQPPPETGSGRLRLARAIVDPDNPLAARVMVNRLWLHHFGRGLVATPDDFGLQGEPPSHPLLLDWLAREFIDSGWSIKHMHRLMVLSSAYRMSSRADDEQALTQPSPPGRGQGEGAGQADPQNVLLHRMNVRRLEGEQIRDGLLAISGRLDERQYGPGVLPHLTPFMEGRGRPGSSGPLDGDGRRSIYIAVRRNFLTPLFLAFDLPTPSTTVGRRSVSNVPAQALTMMNNPFVLQQAELWANRTLDDAQASGRRQPADATGDLSRERIRQLYESAFSRLPSEEELAAALGFLHEQGKEYNGPDDPRTWSDLCHVLLNVKEFVFVN